MPDAPAEAVTLMLAHQPPMDLARTLTYLAHRAIGGVEAYQDGTYTRTLRLPHGAGLVRLRPADGQVRTELRLADRRDLKPALALLGRLLDLAADPAAVDAALAGLPELAPMVRARPGLRSPGAVDGFEMAVRAIVGQQISVAGARTLLGRLAAAHGEPAFPAEPGQPAWLLFPHPAAIAALDPARLPMPAARGRSLITLAAAMADGTLVLDASSDRDRARHQLLQLPGIGPWTADYLRMRALGDPDVYLDSDLGVRHALTALGLRIDAASVAPWRSYLTHHLWASLPARPGPARRASGR